MTIHEAIMEWEHPDLPDNMRFRIAPCSMMNSFYVKLQIRKSFLGIKYWSTWDSGVPFDSSGKMSIPECVVWEMFELLDRYNEKQEWLRLSAR